MSGLLAVRAHGRGMLRCRGCELEHRLGIPGRLGMMRQSRRIHAAAGRGPQGPQHRPVQLDAAMRVDRLVDRQARQLVPERDGLIVEPEHA